MDWLEDYHLVDCLQVGCLQGYCLREYCLQADCRQVGSLGCRQEGWLADLQEANWVGCQALLV